MAIPVREINHEANQHPDDQPVPVLDRRGAQAHDVADQVVRPDVVEARRWGRRAGAAVGGAVLGVAAQGTALPDPG